MIPVPGPGHPIQPLSKDQQSRLSRMPATQLRATTLPMGFPQRPCMEAASFDAFRAPRFSSNRLSDAVWFSLPEASRGTRSVPLDAPEIICLQYHASKTSPIPVWGSLVRVHLFSFFSFFSVQANRSVKGEILDPTILFIGRYALLKSRTRRFVISAHETFFRLLATTEQLKLQKTFSETKHGDLTWL
jgi:hypothetical protein